LEIKIMKDLILKRLNAFILTLILSIPFFTPPSQSANPLKIYVMQVIQHPALDASRKGIYDELIAQGMAPDKDFVWSYESAQGNATLASQIAQKAVSNNADAIVTLGTMVTQTALAATQGGNIPVVFASVTDPVGSKIVASIQKPGGNATGVSNLTPSEPQFRMFMKIQPSLKKLGIIYSPGEANSISLNEDMKVAAQKVGLELVFAPAFKTSEVGAAATKLLEKVDAYFINNDGPALAAFGNIVGIAESQSKPVYVSDTDMVDEGGALAALGPNQYELGRQTGKMLVGILRGKKPEDMPVEFATTRAVKLNPTMAEKLGVKLPAAAELEKLVK
jgi:putative tryptophan/tyrosine transport system substrate-binding protein